MYYSGFGPDGKVYCKHMEEAAKRTANTPKHPNRDFYCCKRLRSDPTKCNFWYWADQVPQAKYNPVPASNSPAAQSPVLRPSMEGSTRAHPTATPPTRRPQKHSAPSNGPPETPRSKKRLEDIEAGLRQREHDLSPIRPQAGPSREPGPSTSLSGSQIIPQPPSPVPTEVDSEVETQPRKSFLGLHYSPEPVTSTIKVEDQPTTPKKRRLTPPTEGTAVQPAVGAASFGDGLPLTPPQTTRRAAQAGGPEPASAIMRSRKGKEREGVPPVQTQDQAGPSGEPREEDSLPLFTRPEDTSSTSSVSPTIAENVLDYTDGIKARVKTLSEYMDSFDITQAAMLLQTVERQKIKYECRDQSQKLRIEELVAEKDKLVAEVSRLKEELQLSEESNRVKDAEIASLKGSQQW